jgi:predicted DNA-binding WGR domain protein
MTKQYYEFKDASTSKFWEINVVGSKITIRYGKTGTPGQTILKSLKSPTEAKEQAKKVIIEKTKKGYKKK